MNINERLSEAENKIKCLEAKIKDLTVNTEQKSKTPYTLAGGNRDRTNIGAIDASAGMGQIKGSGIVWNTEELKHSQLNSEPTNPEEVDGAKGYAKHSHSKFSGGALIVDVLEFVEYVWGTITNKHSQSYWKVQPEIATEKTSLGEVVEKKGKLELFFNPDTKSWGTGAYEIQVDRCYFVERDNEGNILLDSNGNEMKSCLYDEDPMLSSIVWDKNAQKWRLQAVYASGAE